MSDNQIHYGECIRCGAKAISFTPPNLSEEEKTELASGFDRVNKLSWFDYNVTASEILRAGGACKEDCGWERRFFTEELKIVNETPRTPRSRRWYLDSPIRDSALEAKFPWMKEWAEKQERRVKEEDKRDDPHYW